MLLRVEIELLALGGIDPGCTDVVALSDISAASMSVEDRVLRKAGNLIILRRRDTVSSLICLINCIVVLTYWFPYLCSISFFVFKFAVTMLIFSCLVICLFVDPSEYCRRSRVCISISC